MNEYLCTQMSIAVFQWTAGIVSGKSWWGNYIIHSTYKQMVNLLAHYHPEKDTTLPCWLQALNNIIGFC